MIEVRPATPEDIEDVLGRLSDVSRDEKERCGPLPLAGAVPRPPQGIYVDGSLEAVFCFLDTPEGRITSAFAATDRFFKMPRATLWLRRYLREFQRLNPGRVIEAESWSPHPRMHRWFMALGYRFEETRGDHACFRYVEKKG